MDVLREFPVRKSKKQKQPKELPPIEYRTSDGFRVLVGRNNVQNEKLSLKTAMKSDMWLHTQKVPGSHVIIKNTLNRSIDNSIYFGNSLDIKEVLFEIEEVLEEQYDDTLESVSISISDRDYYQNSNK